MAIVSWIVQIRSSTDDPPLLSRSTPLVRPLFPSSLSLRYHPPLFASNLYARCIFGWFLLLLPYRRCTASCPPSRLSSSSANLHLFLPKASIADAQFSSINPHTPGVCRKTTRRCTHASVWHDIQQKMMVDRCVLLSGEDDHHDDRTSGANGGAKRHVEATDAAVHRLQRAVPTLFNLCAS